MSKKVCLVILDGWGNGKKDRTDAIFTAKTPFVDSLYRDNAYSFLLTDGLNVGLPEGQMGNSEVGHMNIGAGRVVFQDLVRINNSVKDGSFYENPILVNAITSSKKKDKSLHLMGLIGRGGVHANQDHLVAICNLAEKLGHKKVFIHAFMDGRDTDPKSGLEFMAELEQSISNLNSSVASVVGRYYAMDRDKRWERIKKAYDLLVKGEGSSFKTTKEGIESSYREGVTDEFILPFFIEDSKGNPKAEISKDDTVICFNFRTDRCRQITEVLTKRDIPEYGLKVLDIDYLTMTNYDVSFKNVKVLFDKRKIPNTLGEFLSTNGKTQLRIAETEKYAHVSFFFSGGREEEFEGESRIMIPSPKVATYDLQPEMSAKEVRDAVMESMVNQAPDFICLNFANPDMVGHTGVFEAITKACETVDSCLSDVVKCGLQNEYSFIVIADHGNADNAVNNDGTPNTAHSLNPVPVIVIDENIKNVDDGKLADVAPTIIKLLGMTQPIEMTGKTLI